MRTRGGMRGLCVGREIVILKIDHTDKTPAASAVRLYALHIDVARRELPEDRAAIGAHRPGGAVNTGVLPVSEPCLRQDHFQRGGSISHELAAGFPVRRLGGKLVAGDDRPLLRVRGGKVG